MTEFRMYIHTHSLTNSTKLSYYYVYIHLPNVVDRLCSNSARILLSCSILAIIRSISVPLLLHPDCCWCKWFGVLVRCDADSSSWSSSHLTVSRATFFSSSRTLDCLASSTSPEQPRNAATASWCAFSKSAFLDSACRNCNSKSMLLWGEPSTFSAVQTVRTTMHSSLTMAAQRAKLPDVGQHIVTDENQWLGRCTHGSKERYRRTASQSISTRTTYSQSYRLALTRL